MIVSPSVHQRAFTLVEMLVVMVLIGLLVTLLMQGFGYAMGIYQRVVQRQYSAYSETMMYQWMESTLGAQIAARPKDRGLEGDQNQVSTYSFRPLVASPGLKTLVNWQLESTGGQLGQTSFVVRSWPSAAGEFEYLADDGSWHSQWPVEKTTAPALPEAVRLVIRLGSDQLNYVVAVETRKRPEVTMEEAQYGR
jgi:general secretion pathway protein J